MLFLFLVIIVLVTVIIGVVLLQTKTTTNKSTLTNLHPHKASTERKYVDSVKVLAELSEQRTSPVNKPRLSITLNNSIIINKL